MKRGVDFDGTLAVYKDFEGVDVLGEPIPVMVERVRRWLSKGDDVVIFTARVHPDNGDEAQVSADAIRKWCLEQFGVELEVTCMKDPKMMEIWDDKAVRVEENTGLVSDQRRIMEKDVDPSMDGIGAFLEG